MEKGSYMQSSNSRRISRMAVTAVAIAALTSAGVSAIGTGSAHASSGGVDQWAPTYTCDTLAYEGNNTGQPGTVVIKGTGNCVASNGASTTGGYSPVDASLAGRDGTVYHCYTGYLGVIFVDLPTFVEGIECVPAS
jgi:hypothetical protein